jgi:ABC-type branched-subunit amino acid transport system substrate-binding protein
MFRGTYIKPAIVLTALVASSVVAARSSMAVAARGSSSSKASSSTVEIREFGSAGPRGVILLGAMDPEGSAVANFGSHAAAAAAAALTLNEHGGVNGKKVKLIFCNTGSTNTPNQAIACVQELIRDKVVAVVGSEPSGPAAEIITLLQNAHIPMIDMLASAGLADNSPQVFRFGQNATTIAGATLLAQQVLHSKRVVDDSVSLNAGPGPFWYSLEKKVQDKMVGQTLVGNVDVPIGTASFDSIAAEIVKPKPDTVISSQPPGYQIPLVNAVEGLGLHPNWVMIGDATREGDLAQFGAAASRVWVAQDAPPVSAATQYPKLFPGMVQYVQSLKKLSASGGYDSSIADVQSSSTRSYAATIMVAKLAGTLPTLTGASLTAALDKAHGLTSGGIMPPWTPNTKGCIYAARRISPSVMFVYYTKSINNQLTLVNTKRHFFNQYLCRP